MRRAQRGFTLIEVLVALVLLGTAGVALFEWFGRSIDTEQRSERRMTEARLTHAALGLLDGVNPAEQPTGEIEQFGINMRWTSELVAAEQLSTMFNGSNSGAWRVGLYRLTMRAQEPATGLDVHYEVLKTGRRRS